MFAKSHLDKLNHWSGSALTWYTSEGRLDFTGPNVYRWLAKTTNFLISEFGESPQALLILDLPPSWRTLYWLTSAGLAELAVTTDRSLVDEADLVVTTDASFASALVEEQPGLPVLLQDLGPLSLRWMGPTVPGALDAIGEISAQPDTLVYPASGEATDLVESDFIFPEDVQAVVITKAEPDYATRIWHAWSVGKRALWADASLDIEAILKQETL